MICATCKAEGKTSRVFPLGVMKTLLSCQPFYDEHGKYHHHDSNRATGMYRCSNGHNWEERLYATCTCGWTNRPKDEPHT